MKSWLIAPILAVMVVMGSVLLSPSNVFAANPPKNSQSSSNTKPPVVPKNPVVSNANSQGYNTIMQSPAVKVGTTVVTAAGNMLGGTVGATVGNAIARGASEKLAGSLAPRFSQEKYDKSYNSCMQSDAVVYGSQAVTVASTVAGTVAGSPVIGGITGFGGFMAAREGSKGICSAQAIYKATR